ncbi:MAG: hypothetical protein ACPKQO_09590, partial [Nitrososphaeraceae archaeon]
GLPLEICRGIDTTDYAVEIFTNFATVRDLTPEGTATNLDKSFFAVVEDEPDDIIDTDNNCFATDFRDGMFYVKEFENSTHFLNANYETCQLYVGECDGIIHPGEIKECTVQNYIYGGEIGSIPKDNNGENG